MNLLMSHQFNVLWIVVSIVRCIEQCLLTSSFVRSPARQSSSLHGTTAATTNMYNRFTIQRHDLKANEINVHGEWHDQCARYMTTFPTPFYGHIQYIDRGTQSEYCLCLCLCTCADSICNTIYVRQVFSLLLSWNGLSAFIFIFILYFMWFGWVLVCVYVCWLILVIFHPKNTSTNYVASKFIDWKYCARGTYDWTHKSCIVTERESEKRCRPKINGCIYGSNISKASFVRSIDVMSGHTQ